MTSRVQVRYRDGDSWSEQAAENDGENSKRGLAAQILFLAVLTVVGTASACQWRASGWPSFGSLRPATVSASNIDNGIGQSDLESLRLQIVELDQLSKQALVSQQAEIKRIADQIANLVAKVELMQRSETPLTPGAKFDLPKKHNTESGRRSKSEDTKPVDAQPTRTGGTGTAETPQRVAR